NRDLLVAVLALLTDAITRSGLSTALNAWSRDRKQSLEQLLLGVGGLDGDRLRALQCLAAAHLKGHQNDLRLSLEAWNAPDLTQEVLTEIHVLALRSTLCMSLGGDPTLAPGQGVARWTERLEFTQEERFLPIRPHA